MATRRRCYRALLPIHRVAAERSTREARACQGPRACEFADGRFTWRKLVGVFFNRSLMYGLYLVLHAHTTTQTEVGACAPLRVCVSAPPPQAASDPPRRALGRREPRWGLAPFNLNLRPASIATRHDRGVGRRGDGRGRGGSRFSTRRLGMQRMHPIARDMRLPSPTRGYPPLAAPPAAIAAIPRTKEAPPREGTVG